MNFEWRWGKGDPQISQISQMGRRPYLGDDGGRRPPLQTPSQAERLNHDVAWMGWCVVFAAWEEVLSFKFVSFKLEKSFQFSV